MAGPAPDDITYLAGLVRQADRPRYYSALFAPEPLRSDLLALYGFAAEIERIPDQVSEPMLGEIRLRWWRDALTGEGKYAEGGQSPALRALGSAVARHGLPIEPLLDLIDARSADLYSDPPPAMGDVDNYFDRTEGTVFGLAALICGAGAGLEGAARDAGIAYGLARRLAVTAADRAHRRTIFTANQLVAEGLTAADVFAPAAPATLHGIAASLGQLARQHVERARKTLAAAPPRALSAFLPLAAVAPLLRQTGRLGPAILERSVTASDLSMLVAIGSARLRGRV